MCQCAWLSERYVSSSVIRSLLSYIETRVGLDQPEIQGLGLRESDLNEANFRYSGELYQTLMAIGAEQSGDESFGFHYGQLADTKRWGVIGYLLTVSENVKQFLQAQAKYQSLVGNIGCTLLHEDGDDFIAEWFTEGVPNKHLAEEAIAGWVQFGRVLTQGQFNPSKIHFRHTAPENTAEYQAFFNCPIAFGSPINGVSFPKSMLDLPIKQSDKRMFETLNLHAGQLLEEVGGDNLKQRIRAYIIRELPRGVPTIDAVAKRFNSSVRTLQRRFTDWDTNYKQFIDTIREELALSYLDRGGASLVELTFMLGFSEQSAMQRAFKRWTGKSPKRYQEEQLEVDSVV